MARIRLQVRRGVTPEQLPVSPPPGVGLWCRECREMYSASRGDYWSAAPGEPLACRGGYPEGKHARVLLQLARRRTIVEPWKE